MPKIPLQILGKLIIPTLIIVPLSLILAILIAEWVIRFAQPQLTYSQAKSVSLKVTSKSDLIPSDLKPNHETIHIGNTHEFSYPIKINSLGYRMKEFTIKKPPDEYRILMLGDSMTFGYGVEQEYNIPSKLEEKLNRALLENSLNGKKVQIINAGFTGGKAPDTYYLYLAKIGLELEPDLVIVNYFLNNDISDLDDHVWEKTDAAGLPEKISSKTTEVHEDYTRLKRQYQNWKFSLPILRQSHLWILFATTLETKSPAIVAKIKKLMGIEDRLPLVEIQDVENCLFNQICTPKMQELEKRFYTIVKATNDLALQNEVPLVVTLLPANPQIKNVAQSATDVNEAQPQKRLREFLEANSIAYIDPLAYMTDENWQKYYFGKDGHPTVDGYGQLSLALYDFLTRDWLFLDKIK